MSEVYCPSDRRYEKMKYVPCGKSGLKLPEVSLGMWHNFGKFENYEVMKEIVFAAFDCGICHFDLANNYGFPYIGSAEENMGRILSLHLKEHRNELLISTKAGYRMWEGPYGDFGSRKYLISSLDDSLKRLQLDYVDLFYHHRPDPNTPLEETMGALAQIVQSGKALYVGLSNYDGETMKRAAEILRDLRCPFVINQNRYSLLDRRVEGNGLLSAAEEEGKGVIAFSPLAQGLLTEKYLEEIPKNSRVRTSGIYLKEEQITTALREKLKALSQIAKDRGESLAQMALAWVLEQPAVTSVLVGASSAEQVRENCRVVGRSPMTEEEKKKIETVLA